MSKVQEIDEMENTADAGLEAIVGDAHMLMQNKEAERQQLQNDIEAFLAQGGQINAVEQDVMADPPKKPQSSYGSQPI